MDIRVDTNAMVFSEKLLPTMNMNSIPTFIAMKVIEPKLPRTFFEVISAVYMFIMVSCAPKLKPSKSLAISNIVKESAEH